MKDTWEGQYAIYGETKKYNGITVYFTGMELFEDAKKVCADEGLGELKAIHAMTISADPWYKKHRIVENPIYNPKGTAFVGRIETTEGGLSAWIYEGEYNSPEDCSQVCIHNCACQVAGDLSFNSGFRKSIALSFQKQKA